MGDVPVTSAGTLGLIGEPIDDGVVPLLVERGARWQDHQARRITKEMVVDADLVLTATREHRAAVVTLTPKALRKTFTLRDFAQIGALVPEEELPDADTALGRVERAARLVAAKRGHIPPLDGADADIMDPYRQAPEVYRHMADQIEDALPGLLRVLATANP